MLISNVFSLTKSLLLKKESVTERAGYSDLRNFRYASLLSWLGASSELTLYWRVSRKKGNFSEMIMLLNRLAKIHDRGAENFL